MRKYIDRFVLWMGWFKPKVTHTETEHGVFEEKETGIRIFLPPDVRDNFIAGEEVPLTAIRTNHTGKTKAGRYNNSLIEKRLRMAIDFHAFNMLHVAIALGASKDDVYHWFAAYDGNYNIESMETRARKCIKKWTDFRSAKHFINNSMKTMKLRRGNDPENFDWETSLLSSVEQLDALQNAYERAKEKFSAQRSIERKSKRVKKRPSASEERNLTIGDSNIPSIDNLLIISCYAGIDPSELWEFYKGYYSRMFCAVAELCQLTRKQKTQLSPESYWEIQKFITKVDLPTNMPDQVSELISIFLQTWIDKLVGRKEYEAATLRCRELNLPATLINNA